MEVLIMGWAHEFESEVILAEAPVKASGKGEVIPWLKAGSADQKKPIIITNAATKDWGVFEYWNIGTVSEDLIKFGNEQKWPWSKSPDSFLGKKYRAAQCVVYHINQEGKIDFMRQYLDAGRVWEQLK